MGTGFGYGFTAHVSPAFHLSSKLLSTSAFVFAMLFLLSSLILLYLSSVALRAASLLFSHSSFFFSFFSDQTLHSSGVVSSPVVILMSFLIKIQLYLFFLFLLKIIASWLLDFHESCYAYRYTNKLYAHADVFKTRIGIVNMDFNTLNRDHEACFTIIRKHL